MAEPLANLVGLALGHIDCDVDPAATAPARAADALVIDLDAGPPVPETGRQGAVVGLTRRWAPAARFAAIAGGVDDLVQVPFAPDEIVARMLLALRRGRRGPVGVNEVIRRGAFQLDVGRAQVVVDGRSLRLTPTETMLLYLFVANPGVVFTREGILRDLWGADHALTSNVVDRHIRDLRVKLQEGWRSPRFIETVPGQGYRFIAPARTEDD
jgi:two-component system response regulator MtrA